jgi:rubrerythrin
VTQEVLEGKREIEGQIPERRPEPEELEKLKAAEEDAAQTPAVERKRGLPVWRCKVCGYLAAREAAPKVCPICKASQDRFEEFPPRSGPALPVWRCKVCGYLAAREAAPKVCPICKASQDRFEEFPL